MRRALIWDDAEDLDLDGSGTSVVKISENQKLRISMTSFFYLIVV